VRSSETHECRDRQVNLANQADGPRDRVELTVQVLGPGLTGSRISAVDLSRRAKSNEIPCAKNGCATNFQRATGSYGNKLSAVGGASDRPARFAEVILFAFGKCPAAFLGALILGVEQVNC
jgi:hypothetical protein